MNYLTVAQAEAQQSSSLWVLNTADTSEAEEAGDILMAIPRLTGSGQTDVITLDLTWLPQDITEWIPRAQALESADFRRAVRKGLISIISEQDAQKILRRPGAKEERQRLASARKYIREVATARAMGEHDEARIGSVQIAQGSGSDYTSVDVYDQHEQLSVAQAALNPTELIGGLEPKFIAWCDRLKQKTDMQAYNDILNKGKMNRRQLKAILKALPASHTTARESVTKRLAKLEAKKAK